MAETCSPARPPTDHVVGPRVLSLRLFRSYFVFYICDHVCGFSGVLATVCFGLNLGPS